MPRRSRVSQARNLPKTKRVKKSHDEENEPFRSPFTVRELWQKIHFYLLKESFGYLDLRNSTKLGRVSTSWRDVLGTTVSTNKGVVFLDWRVSNGARKQMGEALVASKSWMSVSEANFNAMKHFVSVGKTCVFDNFNKYEKLFDFSHSLAKITFWGNSFTDETLCEMVEFFFVETFGRIELKNCTIRREEPYINFEDGYHNLAWGKVDFEGLRWKMKFKIACLVFNVSPAMTEDSENLRQWLYIQLDEMNLIWPYGEDQLEWLKKSMDNLKGKTLKAVRYADEKYIEWRPCYDFDEEEGNLLRPMNIESTATSDQREMDTLDCAFFGRLLVCMNKGKRIPKFKPPPHAFPNDFDILMGEQ